MKRFTATIEARSLEKAIDIPGWSHAEPEFTQRVLWYPWQDQFRKIHFTAKHRTEACKQLDRLGIIARDLSDGVAVK